MGGAACLPGLLKLTAGGGYSGSHSLEEADEPLHRAFDEEWPQFVDDFDLKSLPSH